MNKSNKTSKTRKSRKSKEASEPLSLPVATSSNSGTSSVSHSNQLGKHSHNSDDDHSSNPKKRVKKRNIWYRLVDYSGNFIGNAGTVKVSAAALLDTILTKIKGNIKNNDFNVANIFINIFTVPKKIGENNVMENVVAYQNEYKRNALKEDPLPPFAPLEDSVGDPFHPLIIQFPKNQNSAIANPFNVCRIPFFLKFSSAVLDRDWLSFEESILLTEDQKVIFIRKCYADLAQLIHKEKSKSAIISGTPGIGKSVFLLYFMWTLLRDGKRVLYVCLPYIIYYDGQGGVFYHSPNTVPDARDETFWNKDLWLLFDAKEINSIQLGTTIVPHENCSFVLSTSPRRDIVNDPQKRISTYFMPVWSKEEIKSLANKCYPQSAWKSRYSVLGGVPRVVLENTKKPATDLIREACNSASLEECINLVASGTVFSEKSKDPFHRLVHIFSSDDYESQNIAFGTKSIARIIAFEKRKSNIAKLNLLIESACSHPKTSALGGYLFEYYAFDCLEMGGQFECRKLVSGKEESPESYFLTIPKSQRRVVEKVERGQTVNRLYVPSTSNYAAIDAWIPGIGGFNMTVAKSHKIKARAKTDLPLLGTNGNKLYWLLTSKAFHSFNKQSPRSIDQYALLIPFQEI